jgi:TonB family protein
VAIRQEDRIKFGTLLEQRHGLKEVCATGLVEKRGKRSHVRVVRPDQLRLKGNAVAETPFGEESLSVCDAGVSLPKILSDVKPRYTAAAVDAQIAGSVFLEAVVLEDGTVGAVRVLRSLDSALGLDAEAISAVRAWRFEPGTREGTAVPVVVTVELTYRLR